MPSLCAIAGAGACPFVLAFPFLSFLREGTGSIFLKELHRYRSLGEEYHPLRAVMTPVEASLMCRGDAPHRSLRP